MTSCRDSSVNYGTSDRKDASSNPDRSGVRIFSPELTSVLTLIRVRSTPLLLHWHVTDPGQSGKSAGGWLT